MEYLFGIGMLILSMILFFLLASARLQWYIKSLAIIILFFLVFSFISNYKTVFSIQDPVEKLIFIAESYKLLFFTNHHLFATTIIYLYKAFIAYKLQSYRYENSYEFWSIVQFCYFLFTLPNFPENYLIAIIISYLSLTFLQILFNRLSPFVLIFMFLIFSFKAFISYNFPFLAFHHLFYFIFGTLAILFIKCLITFYFLFFIVYIAGYIIFRYKLAQAAFYIPESFNEFVLVRDLKKLDKTCTTYFIESYCLVILYWAVMEFGFGDYQKSIWKMVNILVLSIINSLLMRLASKEHSDKHFLNNFLAGCVGLCFFGYLLPLGVI